MKFKKSILAIIFAIGTILFWSACTSSSKSGENETEEHSHEEESDHDEDGHENDDSTSTEGGNELAWTFSDSDEDIFSKSFHFVMGSAQNLEVTASGNSATFNANGSPTAFVFHNKVGNVGVEASYMLHGFEGEIKLVHHFKDEQNYEFVSVNGDQMKLGRVINGEEDIFDEKSFEAESTGWIYLRVSAAGSHFKGYIGSETITHGHGDELDPGYAGMMINGKGSFMVKDIKATIMESE